MVKNRKASSLVMAALFVVGCGGDDEMLVNPSDPISLSQVLVIPNAVRKAGALPVATGTANAPMVTKGAQAAVSVESGNQVVVEMVYTSVTGYDECFVQVQGATDYFVIKQPQQVTSGTIMIPVTVPRSVSGGAFSLVTAITGSDGTVSNPVTTPVTVTRTAARPTKTGDVICASTNAQAGAVYNCPGGKVLDFCISQTSGVCYYLVGTTKIDCGNCQTDQAAIQTCATTAAQQCQ